MQPETKRRIVIVAVVFLLLLSLLNWTKDEEEPVIIDPLESVIQGIFSPIQEFFSSGIKEVRDWFNYIVSYREIIAENQRLKEALYEQEAIMAAYTELMIENRRLRDMLDFQASSNYELVPAAVIARDASQWFSVLTINKGQRDGVEAEMPVVTSAGLVGRVLDANLFTAQVMLLTDPRSRVSVFVQRTRDHAVVGIVEGSPEDAGKIQAVNILPDADVRPGDTVVSSGMGGIYPKGLVVGRVLSVEDANFGLTKEAWVESAVDFNHLEEVLVIKAVPEPPQDIPPDSEGEPENPENIEDTPGEPKE